MFGKDPLSSGFAKGKINSIDPVTIGAAVGGLAGAFGGGGSSTQSTQMPKWLRSYYQDIALPNAQRLYNQGPAEYYEGDMVADLTKEQLAAINMIGASASSDMLNPAGQQYALDVLGGDYLGGDQFMKAYGQDILENVESQFEKGGRAGSQYSVDTATSALGEQAAKLYSGERGLQNQILQGVPSLVTSQFAPAKMQMMAGDVLQQQEQAETEADVRAWDYEQNKDILNLQTFMDFLGKVPTQSQTTTTEKANPLISGLGGAMAGASIGSNWGK